MNAARPDAVQEKLAGLSPERRALLEKLVKKETAAAPPRIVRRAPGSAVPLSFAQQRLWFFEQLRPGTAVYNMPLHLRLPIRVDAAALERTLNEIVRRHEILRTAFQSVDGRPAQVIAPALTVPLPVTDLQPMPAEGRDAELSRLLAIDAHTPFALDQGPLLRARLVRLAPDDHVLSFTMHHIVSDTWSIGIFFQELGALYEAFASGRPSPLPAVPLQYGDFAVWQREWLKEDALDRQLSYWKTHLDGIVPIELPCDRARPATPSFRGGSVPFSLSAGLAARLRSLGAEHDCTLFMTMLAAFQVLLLRYTGQEDVVVGTPVANRNHPEIERVMGFFINSLVMRTDLSGNPTFLEALQRTRDVSLGAYARQDVPFEMLVEHLQPERDLTRNPLFQVLFQLQMAGRMDAEANRTFGAAAAHDNAVFDLNINLWDLSGPIGGAFEYNAELFDQGTVERMAEHYGVLLAAIADAPGGRIGQLALLGDAERRRLLVDWNATDNPCAMHGTVADWIRDQAGRTPHAPAVSADGSDVSYGELMRRAGAVTACLRRQGAGPGDRVGVFLSRSIDAVAAILGVLDAGAAYVPIDPEYPLDRIRFILDDCDARLVMTEARLRDRLEGVRAPLLVLPLAAADEPGDVPAVNGGSLAYVIYTSGSTGRPKGVAISHDALRHSTWARFAHYGGPVGRFLLLSPFAFDSSVAGLFWTLSTGGCLHVATERDIGRPEELAARIERDGVTHLLAIPTLYQRLLEAFDPAASPLQVAIVAGEPLLPSLVRQHLDRLPHVALHNEYGPTEAAVWATVHQCGAGDAERAPGIGRPIANTRVYVVDEHGELAPTGAPGELWIGGAGLADGYWGRSDLTRERFVADPFRNDDSRVYRTGDRVRYRADGRIEFLGRLDHQVKLRGFRIELGEVEAVLQSHPAVVECAAFVWRHAGDPRLAAACVVRDAAAVDGATLIEFLRERLPQYAVPSLVNFVPALPRNPNGKLDRRALVADPDRVAGSQPYVAPRNDVEETIAAIYRELLGVQQPSVLESFYRLGGHSLLATQLLSRVNDAFQLSLALPVMFEADTIASLAEVVQHTLLDEIAGMTDVEIDDASGSPA